MSNKETKISEYAEKRVLRVVRSRIRKIYYDESKQFDNHRAEMTRLGFFTAFGCEICKRHRLRCEAFREVLKALYTRGTK